MGKDVVVERDQKPVPMIRVGTWGYYPYDKNTKPDAIRGKQTELPEIFVPGTRR